MKKSAKFIVILLVLAMVLSACGSGSSSGGNEANTNTANTSNAEGNTSSEPTRRGINVTQEEIVRFANKNREIDAFLEAIFDDGLNAVDKKETIGLTKDEIKGLAAKSSSVWELLCYMFPDHAVYTDEDNGFVLERARADVEKNQYDWSNLSKAIRGIDVSKHQGSINWQAVATDDVKFAIIRVGYRGYETPLIVEDEFFDINMQGATAAGIPVGVYFYSKARTVKEAKEEAEFVIRKLRPYNVTWPVIIDVEIESESDRVANLDKVSRSENIIAFCEAIKEAGYEPMIYSYIGVYTAKMDYVMLKEYPKWFAMYFNEPHYPYAFQIWQASDSGTVSGIEGPVDINYSFVDYGDKH